MGKLRHRSVLISEGVYSVKASMTKDVSLLERCPHFRGCTFVYIQTSMELRPEDVSLLERCPHFRGCIYIVYRLQWSFLPII